MTKEDISNASAWAEIIGDVYHVPRDIREDVILLALERQREKLKEASVDPSGRLWPWRAACGSRRRRRRTTRHPAVPGTPPHRCLITKSRRCWGMTMLMIDFNQTDNDALERAVKLALADPDRAEQVRTMLRQDTWYEVAQFCASIRQEAALQLRLWETPPCDIDPEMVDAIIAKGPLDNPAFGGAKLLKRLLSAGCSAFEPDPLNAIEASRKTK